MSDAARRAQMEKSTVSPHPTEENLMMLPIVTTPDGGMYRLVTHDGAETCINAEVPGTATTAKNYTFKLQSYASLEQSAEEAPATTSRAVKVLGAAGSKTQVQVCFGAPDVITEQTAYLVLEADPGGLFGSPSFAVWHFDDSVRRM
jgi:hypothetical protein